MVTATRQTLDIMSWQDVVTLEPDGRTIQDGIRGCIALTGGAHRVEVIIAFNSGGAERLASKVSRRDAKLDYGGLDVFGELSNTIGGRARAALHERNVDLYISLPDITQKFDFDGSDAMFDTSA